MGLSDLKNKHGDTEITEKHGEIFSNVFGVGSKITRRHGVHKVAQRFFIVVLFIFPLCSLCLCGKFEFCDL